MHCCRLQSEQHQEKNKHLIYSCMQKCFSWRLYYIVWMIYKLRNKTSAHFDLTSILRRKIFKICVKKKLWSQIVTF